MFPSAVGKRDKYASVMTNVRNEVRTFDAHRVGRLGFYVDWHAHCQVQVGTCPTFFQESRAFRRASNNRQWLPATANDLSKSRSFWMALSTKSTSAHFLTVCIKQAGDVRRATKTVLGRRWAAIDVRQSSWPKPVLKCITHSCTVAWSSLRGARYNGRQNQEVYGARGDVLSWFPLRLAVATRTDCWTFRAFLQTKFS